MFSTKVYAMRKDVLDTMTRQVRKEAEETCRTSQKVWRTSQEIWRESQELRDTSARLREDRRRLSDMRRGQTSPLPLLPMQTPHVEVPALD